MTSFLVVLAKRDLAPPPAPAPVRRLAAFLELVSEPSGEQKPYRWQRWASYRLAIASIGGGNTPASVKLSHWQGSRAFAAGNRLRVQTGRGLRRFLIRRNTVFCRCRRYGGFHLVTDEATDYSHRC